MRYTLAAAAGLLGLLAAGCERREATTPPLDANRYYAVQLSTGGVFFGKLQGLGAPYPVLTDIYYVQTETDAATKKSAPVLVKRGREWHAPDRMYLNDKAIVLVEPVGPDSQVARLIANSKR
jgi:hypothetical protein